MVSNSEMDATWKRIVWQQFGAAIDMVDNAVRACPEEVWDGPARCGHLAYHALFFLDLYLVRIAGGICAATAIQPERARPERCA